MFVGHLPHGLALSLEALPEEDELRCGRLSLRQDDWLWDGIGMSWRAPPVRKGRRLQHVSSEVEVKVGRRSRTLGLALRFPPNGVVEKLEEAFRAHRNGAVGRAASVSVRGSLRRLCAVLAA